MASLYPVKIKSGNAYRIQEVINGERRSIFLGKMSKKMAETICSYVEQINVANLAGQSCPAEVARWLGTISDDLHGKLSKVGLIPARHSRTLAAFLEAYKAERIDAKPSTVRAWNTSIKKLVSYFGDVPLRTISNEQAALYRTSLVKQGYATAFIAKSIMIARMFFNVAKRRKLIDENPFQYVETGSQVNKEREHYVTHEETNHLINACSNAKDRLKIALARYAGLRIPSELVGLRWSEVNWENGRFIVHSPKTERKGKAKRIVPIFEKLYPYLLEAAESAPEGEDRIFPEIHEKKSMGSWIHKLAARAGVPLWEKPFQNMRATCATELQDFFPGNVCADWLGHTEKVADRHYRQTTETHFQKATGIVCSENRAVDVNPLTPQQSQEKKCAKSCAAPAGNGSQINEATNKKAVNCSVLQSTADACEAQNGRYKTRTCDP